MDALSGVIETVAAPLQSILSAVGLDLGANTIFLIIVALIVVIIGPLATKGGKSSRARGNTVYMVGITGAGKTAMFYQMLSGKYPNTVVSMRPNEAVIPFGENKKPVKVVDFPGHRRLREDLLTAMPTAGALVYVIDSINIKTEIRSVAQFLYDIFTNQDVNKASIPVLIACNKQDIVTAAGPTEIQSLVEKELEQLRSTRASTPMQEGTQRGEEIFLGIEGEKFKLEHLPMQVTFVDCSAKEGDLDSVKSWIASNM